MTNAGWDLNHELYVIAGKLGRIQMLKGDRYFDRVSPVVQGMITDLAGHVPKLTREIKRYCDAFEEEADAIMKQELANATPLQKMAELGPDADPEAAMYAELQDDLWDVHNLLDQKPGPSGTVTVKINENALQGVLDVLLRAIHEINELSSWALEEAKKRREAA